MTARNVRGAGRRTFACCNGSELRAAPVHVVSGGVTARDRCRKPRGARRHLCSAPEVHAEPEEPTLLQAGYRWLASYVATTRNPKGQRLARARFDKYVIGWLGGTPLRELNGDHVREFRLMLEDHWHLRAYTVTHVLSDLRCFLRWAVSAGWLDRSPFPDRVMPRIAECAPRGLDDREVATLTACPGHAGFVLRLLLGTGLRWAEACRASVTRA